MPQASFPPLPGSLPHYHSGRASPERYDNRYEQGFSESFGTTLGKHSYALIRSALPRSGHNKVGRYYRSLMYIRLGPSDTLDKTNCCIGPGLWGTSENPQNANLGEQGQGEGPRLLCLGPSPMAGRLVGPSHLRGKTWAAHYGQLTSGFQSSNTPRELSSQIHACRS